MGRRKLPLELISNEKARRITYEKRKKCMMKKAQELTTLCGVDTCMIIHGPAGSSSSSAAAAAAAKPEIWPPSPEKVKRIFRRYTSEVRDRRAKRTVGLPESSANQKRKVVAELAKARLAKWEAKYPTTEALIRDLSKDNLRRLYGSLGQTLDVAKARLAAVKEDAMRRSSHVNDRHVHTNDRTDDHHHTRGLSQDHCPVGDVRPWENFRFAIPEGLMLSRTPPSYGPITVGASPEGAPSFEPCRGALSAMQEGPNYAGFFAGGFPVPLVG